MFSIPLALELFSFPFGIESITPHKEKREIHILSKLNMGTAIWNENDLAHKCKEWAYENQKGNIDRWLRPQKNPNWEHDNFTCYVNGYEHKYFYAATESEVIFMACDWILKQKIKTFEKANYGN